jgi:hypothetical protein
LLYPFFGEGDLMSAEENRAIIRRLLSGAGGIWPYQGIIDAALAPKFAISNAFKTRGGVNM